MDDANRCLAAWLQQAGVLSAAAAEAALTQCQQSGVPLLQALLATGALSYTAVQELLLRAAVPPAEAQAMPEETLRATEDDPFLDDRHLQAALLASSRLSPAQLQTALAEQQRTGHPLWRTLLNLGLLAPYDLVELMHTPLPPGYVQDPLLLEALRALGGLAPEQREELETRGRARDTSLVQYCLDKGWLTREAVGQLLARYLQCPFVDVRREPPDEALLRLLPRRPLWTRLLVPLRLEGDALLVAMANPRDQASQEWVQQRTGYRVRPLLALEDDLREVLRRHGAAAAAVTPYRFLEGREAATAVELVDAILEGAVRAQATDIHIEPHLPRMRVRYRVDGRLFDVATVPPALEMAVISRIKILADMDITERRLPQDGHLTARFEGQEYHMRVATIPTPEGEKLVIRLLSRHNVLMGLKQLGLEPEDERRLRALIATPQGMILVTGPIGSGKTTTLYAALNEINVLTRNIVTIEDPIEYRLAGITQVQVDPKAGLTFASGLRSMLRQDADVLMVGEIRDVETATVAIRAALTGQQLFSTLHTADAPSAITTLEYYGIQPYLVASALSGVVAQRLVRTVCPQCRQWYTPSPALVRQLGLPPSQAYRFAYGAGCAACYDTGYRGRTGIFEILQVTDTIRRLITERAPETAIQAAAVREGMSTLVQSGIKKVLRGLTTPQEVMREVFL
ncbi:MAG: type II secretion system protein E [Candidatus Tectimicrobiota bacterium]|nr:MAG: type II secretion system protein E [Candidatus Tectomicrobia bacterium]